MIFLLLPQYPHQYSLREFFRGSLGEILYFQDVKRLSRLIILRPSWVSELIAKVVRSKVARTNGGVLCLSDLDELWQADHLDSAIREHLLRLMDYFDLTYSTLDANDARIVVEALPYATPEDRRAIELPADQPKMEYIYQFPTLERHLPPGIPTWGIARAHRFSCPGNGPWRDAAYFEDNDTGSRALIRASDLTREVRLQVSADYPPSFMGLLDGILRDTFSRYKELLPQRYLPCRCRPGCTQTYRYDTILKRAKAGKESVSCDRSSEDVPIATLLTGYTPTTDVGLRAKQVELRRDYTTLISSIVRGLNEQMWKICPSVITLLPSHDFALLPTYWESVTQQDELELCLYCEYDSGWHITQSGNYRFRPDQQWACRLRDKWNSLVAISQRVAPLAKVVVGDSIVTPIGKIGSLVADVLPGRNSDVAELALGLGQFEQPQLADLETRKLLRELIDLLDKGRKANERNGGLDRCIVEDGRLLWLCPVHLRPYQGQ